MTRDNELVSVQELRLESETFDIAVIAKVPPYFLYVSKFIKNKNIYINYVVILISTNSTIG